VCEIPRPDDLRIAESLVAGGFAYLNRPRRLVDVDWEEGYESRLWTYTLHSWDWAPVLGRAWSFTGDERFGRRLLALWKGWLAGATNRGYRLEPYPTSSRCINVIRTLAIAGDRLPPAIATAMLGTLQEQLRWLEGNLEHHLMANHLQKNLQALVWGGLVFRGAEAERWRGLERAFWEQFREQVLDDGGHFERSPMYHASALVDFAETIALFRVANRYVPADAETRLDRMGQALRVLSRPSGSLHLFNDAANGMGPGPEDAIRVTSEVLEREIARPGGPVCLAETGYHAWLGPESGTRVIVDAGPPGPPYQPGHAHCDMLSFELDLGGRPVVVDSGVHGYDGDPFREYARSTRAHNTVAIGGREQHEVWATFRMARRGSVVSASSGESEGAWRFRGACRPYHDRKARHEREIVLRGEELRVEDRVTGARGARLASWVHLHPDFEVEEVGGMLVARAPEMGVTVRPFGVDTVRVVRGARDPVQGWHFPEFGLAQPAAAIELAVELNDGRTFGWTLARA
jgi:uncharacterized heparinase superfamily protein